MRMVFSEVVGTLSFLQPQADDDMADRLHYYYTTTFLLVTSVLISLKMYGGRPIECWMPAEYQSSWQEYTEIYCFSMNTYFAPFSQGIPNDEEVREKNMISYYQWTPFFLVICAFLFYSPCLIWRVLYTKSGIRIKDIVAFANDHTNIQPKMREANIKGMSAHLGSVFRHRFRFGSKHPYHHKFLRILNLRFYEAYLTFLYIGIKILFLTNVTIQMFLMNWFLQTSNYRYYGFGVLEDLIYGRPWSDSGNFPRVTYCDMDVRVLGNVQKHTVQCVLVINIFIEKVFVLLWIWYSLLVVATIFSLINWLFSSLPFEARKKFIARRLELADVEFKRANFEEELEGFVRDYIKMDGVFMLRMLTIHAGILVCTEVVDSMWEDFIEGITVESNSTLKTGPMSPQIAAQSTEALDGSQFGLGRRKTSVLVPLVSAQPNGLNQGGFLFQSMMGHSPLHTSQQKLSHPQSAVPYAAAVSAGLAAATAQMFSPKGDFLLKKPPNPQQWRRMRGATGAGGAGGGNAAANAVANLAKRGSIGGSESGKTAAANQSISAPNMMGGGGPRVRRTSHGLPLLGGIGGALAALRTQRSNSAATQQSASIPEPALWEVEEGTGLMRGTQSEEEEGEMEEEMMEEQPNDSKKQSSSSTWHAPGSAGGSRK